MQALPNFPRDVAEIIEQTVKDHILYDVKAREIIRKYNLSQLEAEAVLWWTADASTLSSLSTEESPYFIFNTALRQRNGPQIKLWRDFSFFFISALNKLPQVATTCFRGEKKRVIELSVQYARDNKVSFD